jgi:hypothetical protein
MNQVSGLYASIKGTAGPRDVGKQNKMIGKTLGDTMIVASAMSHFLRYDINPANPPSAPNPFYGANRAIGWKNYGTNDGQTYYTKRNAQGRDVPTFPLQIAVKTSDILNAVRAIFKNVPTILQKLDTGDRPRHFEFFPGAVADVEIAAQLPVLYGRLIGDVVERYDKLIAEFEDTVEDTVAGDILKDGYSRFQPEHGRGFRFFRDGDIDAVTGRRRRAAEFIVQIMNTLGAMRNETVRYFQGRAREPTVEQYREDIQEMLQRCPQTDTVVRYKEGNEVLMKFIIPVQRSPRPKEIHLCALFKSIDTEGVAGGPLMQTFQEHFPLIGGGGAAGAAVDAPMAGGARDTYLSLLNEYIEALTPPEDDRLARRVPLVQLNLATLNAVDEGHNPFLLPADYTPLTCAFVRYTNELDPTISLNRLHRLYSHKNNGYIMDNPILEMFETEFERLLGTSAIQITAGPVETPTQTDILWFNAFTCHVNHENTMISPRGDDIDFNVLEEGFRGILEPPLRVNAAAAAAGAVAPVAGTPGQSRAPASGRGDEATARALAVVGEVSGAEARPVAGTPGRGNASGGFARMLSLAGTGAAVPAAAGVPVPEETEELEGGNRTPRRRKNRKSTYRLKKKPSK